MGSWRIVVGAMAAGLVLAGCAGPAQRDSVSHPGPTRDELVAQADAAPTPKLDWVPCGEPELSRYQCATATVPVDYANPRGATLALAVIRQPATDPARRIGTLVTAVGGPGGSGFDWARREQLFPGELAARFDVVTFDQRGIGRSGQIRCFSNAEEQQRFWSAALLPPVGAEQERTAERAARELAAGCAANGGALLAHLTTADAARDMDLLRRGLGEERLTYTGGSYASYLGEVYGALFGDRVRALQLTSMIDPETYTNDSLGDVRDIAVGTEEVLGEFFRRCAEVGRPRCVFAGDGDASPAGRGVGREGHGASGPAAQALRDRDSAVLQRLQAAPIVVGRAAQALAVRYTDVAPLHAGLLYDQAIGWPALAQLLIQLERGADGDPEVVRKILAASNLGYDYMDAFTAITCADYSVPRNPGQWPALARDFATVAPNFGPFWLYMNQACAAWPAPEGGYPQRYTGPWTLRSQTPALLLNNRFDPVTRMAFAERAQLRLGNARLVLVDGYGHKPVGACVTATRERYLIDLQLPTIGTTCAPGGLPFAE
ncbi:alpha/beta hydrolase [Nocardia sp. NPDC052566]|uniref:alpha/beta hydrolase n=1 Tax=Nocardia sp. NPDC052566 TaxID=3364330 RepID=UPI0037CBA0B6